MAFVNKYTHRKVADTAARGCEICFRASTSVLVTPENKDFFYVCPSHLKDKGFASPIIDQAAVDAKRKKAMDEEVAKVKKAYEEKQQKKSKKADEAKDKTESKTEDGKKDAKEDTTANESEARPEDKASETLHDEGEEEPRVFALQRTFFQQRLDKKRQAEVTKRMKERLVNPSFFPSVPKGDPT